MSDELLVDLVSRPDSCDVRPWLDLARSGHLVSLGELEPEESLRILERLLDLNPVRLVAVDPESDDEFTTTNVLVIQLPPSPDSRAEFFMIESEHAVSTGFDPEPDIGQRFLMMKW